MNAPDSDLPPLQPRCRAAGAHGAAADFLVLRRPVVRARDAAAVRSRPELRRQPHDGAGGRRHDDAAVDRSRQGAGARAERRQPAVEHLPPSPGHAARGPRAPSEHRLSAASLDLRPRRQAARGAGLRSSRPNARCRARPCRSGTGCCSPGRATPAADLADFPLAADYDYSNWCSTRSRSTSVPSTGRPSSRSSSSSITSKRCIPDCRSGSMPAITSGASATAGATRSSASRTN